MKITLKQSLSGSITGAGHSGQRRKKDGIHKSPLPECRQGDKVVLSGGARETMMALWRSRSVSAAAGDAVVSLKEQVQRNAYLFDYPVIARKLVTENLVHQSV